MLEPVSLYAYGMVPNATRVTIRLAVCLSGTAVTIISLFSCLVKNELGNLHSSLLLYCILLYGEFIS